MVASGSRRRRVVVLLLVLLALLTASAPVVVPAPAGAVAKNEPALAVVGETAFTLVRLEPSSLTRLSGPTVPLGRSAFAWSFTADRTKVAIGGQEGLRFVDTRAMRPLGRLSLPHRLALPSNGGTATFFGVQPLAWLAPRRVLVLAPPRELLVVDPVARRVIARRPLGGWVGRWARTDRRLVLLVHSPERIGPARIVVSNADGALRSVRLDRIVAGTKLEDAATFRSRTMMPGLAVDRARERAYVVGAAGTVAEIGLANLAVAYREPSTSRSVLGRLRDWLEPLARGKITSGAIRDARWLGNGLLAVSGSDFRAVPGASGRDGQATSAAGLQLVDTRDWSVRTIDESVSAFTFSDGLLLGWGVTNGADASAGSGVVAYELDGRLRFRLFAGERIGWVGAAGGYGYVPLEAENWSGGVRIVDLTDGSVVAKPAAEVPVLLDSSP